MRAMERRPRSTLGVCSAADRAGKHVVADLGDGGVNDRQGEEPELR
jgi:hypothetical protein